MQLSRVAAGSAVCGRAWGGEIYSRITQIGRKKGRAGVWIGDVARQLFLWFVVGVDLRELPGGAAFGAEGVLEAEAVGGAGGPAVGAEGAAAGEALFQLQQLGAGERLVDVLDPVATALDGPG